MSFLIKIHPERHARVILVHVTEDIPLYKSRLLNRVQGTVCRCMHACVLHAFMHVCSIHLGVLPGIGTGGPEQVEGSEFSKGAAAGAPEVCFQSAWGW